MRKYHLYDDSKPEVLCSSHHCHGFYHRIASHHTCAYSRYSCLSHLTIESRFSFLSNQRVQFKYTYFNVMEEQAGKTEKPQLAYQNS